MADPKIIEKIQKLVRLALHNPNEEEARSAALKALQLASEHKVSILFGQQPQQQAPPRRPPQPPPSAPPPDFYDWMQQQFGGTGTGATRPSNPFGSGTYQGPFGQPFNPFDPFSR